MPATTERAPVRQQVVGALVLTPPGAPLVPYVKALGAELMVQRHADAQPVLEAEIRIKLLDCPAGLLETEPKALSAGRLAWLIAVAEPAIDFGHHLVVDRRNAGAGAQDLADLEHIAGPGHETAVRKCLEAPAVASRCALGVRNAPTVDRMHTSATGRELSVGVADHVQHLGVDLVTVHAVIEVEHGDVELRHQRQADAVEAAACRRCSRCLEGGQLGAICWAAVLPGAFLAAGIERDLAGLAVLVFLEPPHQPAWQMLELIGCGQAADVWGDAGHGVHSQIRLMKPPHWSAIALATP